MRPFGQVSKDVLQNELRVIDKLCIVPNVHKNIVTVIRHGELLNSYHFIDMELCDLDLATYLDRQWSPVEMERTPIGMDQNLNMRMEQVWKIMMDVTSGLAFIHSHKEVHRDLKPRNSNSHGRKY